MIFQLELAKPLQTAPLMNNWVTRNPSEKYTKYLISLVVVPVVKESRRNCVSCWMYTVGSWSILYSFPSSCTSFVSALFVCLIIIIMLHTMNESTSFFFFQPFFPYEIINDCRFYYIAFRVSSLTITLRWSSRNVVASFFCVPRRNFIFQLNWNTLRSSYFRGKMIIIHIKCLFLRYHAIAIAVCGVDH